MISVHVCTISNTTMGIIKFMNSLNCTFNFFLVYIVRFGNDSIAIHLAFLIESNVVNITASYWLSVRSVPPVMDRVFFNNFKNST